MFPKGTLLQFFCVSVMNVYMYLYNYVRYTNDIRYLYFTQWYTIIYG